MTPENASRELLEMARLAPVIPVIVVDELDHAVPLAEALVAGGLPVLEVTLRTPMALPAIRKMSHVPNAIVGAGTVLRAEQVSEVQHAGGLFAVSPGSTEALMTRCEEADMPLLPGAATATEAMRLLERGYSMQKFFPAEASGGAAALGSFASPLPQVTFCPTGGVGLGNAPDYLRLKNVVCVGGSWVAPKKLVETGDWDGISALAAEAVQTLSAVT
ncbi:MAG: bifunctional 4-hydroxy-2-oxoglutarate aldolase/2-dehydro-3-deoxy-phosphogluconate aldolase [Rhodobacteraceae bacterium]|nr:bifunctional 4-hydroxy-2-oxoglutarate aldolase/2-dehydro-3-deoxy-phosphogluconate aldolase [Paracoccaceae bacterium]